MLTPGLVSITFRKLTPPEIIHIVRRGGLRCIEWGGDVHVPHGNIMAARDVQKRTYDAGLTVAAYGSYYRIGESENQQSAFEEVLETAVELKAPTIRVWAGRKGSDETDAKLRMKIVRETQRIADLAADAGRTISLEFHGNTLTDTNESTVSFLNEVDHPNVFSLWQPRTHGTPEESLEGLRAIFPRLSNVHVFYWQTKGKDVVRRPLSAGGKVWETYLETLRTSPRDHSMLLEFVKDDDTELFVEDARTLRSWLEATP